MALFADVATAAEWYVSNTQGAWESGTEKYDGTSATVSGAHGPFFKIQSAIDKAAAGDTVHVAAGTYGDEQGYQVAAGFQDSRSRIWINKAITVKGASRDTTIIQGAHDPAGSAVNGLGSAAVRCVAIASTSGVALSSGSRLESFTLTGGATQNNATDGMGTRGGGVAVPQTSTDRNYIVDCLIKDNAATRGGGGFGGVYVNCIFDGNRADLGAGGKNGGAARTCSMLGCIIVNSCAGNGAVDFINRMVNCTVYGNSQVLRPIGTEPFSQNAGCFVRNSVVLGNDSTVSSIKPNPNVVAGSLDGGNNIARNYDPADTKGDLVAAAFGDYRPVAGGDVADAGDAEALVAFQNETGIPNDLRDYDLFGQPRKRADGKVAAGAVATPIVPQGGALKSRFGAADAVLFNGVQLKAGEAVWADVWPKQVYLTRTGIGSTSGLVCYAVAESNTVATANAVETSYHYPDRADGYWLTYPAAEEPNLQTGRTTPKNAVHNPNVVFLVSSIVGIVRYVNGASTSETEDGSAEHPYKTIQAAVDADSNNRAIRIQVAPGVYGGTREAATQATIKSSDANKNPITIDGGLATVWIPSGNSLFIRSDDGAEQTVIRGVWADTETGIGEGAVRCVAVTASGRPVGLSGFTLENGATLVSSNAYAGWGGGFCSVRTASSALAPNHQLTDSIVRNCTAGRGPGAFGGWYRRVLFTNNVERGGNHYLREAVLSGCIIGPNPDNMAQLLGQNVYCLNSTFRVDPTSRGGFLGGEDKADNVAVGVNCLFFGGKDNAAFRRAAFVGNFWDGATQTQAVGNVTYATVRVADFANGDYRPLAGEPVVGGGSSAYTFYGRHAGTDFDNNPVVGSNPTVDANGKVVLTSGAFVKPVSAVVVSAADGVVATPGGTNVVAVGETKTVTISKDATCARNLLGLVVDGVEKEGVFSWTFKGTDPATRVSLEPLFASDWYADAVHGDDARDGWTPATAKKTLAAAMAAVVPGDTVHAAEGDYDEGTAILATSSSGAGAWRVIVPSRVVVPTGVRLVASGARDRTRIIGRAADQADPPQVRSDGTTVVNKTNLGNSFEADWQTYGVGTNGSVKCVTLQPNARIRGFTLTGGRTGCPEDVTADYTLGAAVLGYDADTSVVEDCLILNNASGRAVVYNATAINCDIRDNVALWNGGFGRKARFVGSRLRGNVSPYLAAEACYGFYNCTIDGNWCDGAKTKPLTGLAKNGPAADIRFQLVNTIVMGMSKTVMSENVYGDVLNCVLEEGFAKDTSFTATNLFANVTFAARGAVLRENGRTRTSSVAIGAGDPNQWLAVWGDRDLYGNDRFLDGKIDIGPEQFDPARRKGFLLLIR